MRLPVRALLFALWAGMLLTVGALVAPLLFQALPERHLAGAVAGSLFRAAALTSLAIGALLLLHDRARSRSATAALPLAATLGPVALLLLSQFVVRPAIEALGTAAQLAPGSVFALWHTLSGALYWAAAAWVLVGLVRAIRQDGGAR